METRFFRALTNDFRSTLAQSANKVKNTDKTVAAMKTDLVNLTARVTVIENGGGGGGTGSAGHGQAAGSVAGSTSDVAAAPPTIRPPVNKRQILCVGGY
eukprot:6373605-Pyramimonas_sp.AAC.1